MATASLLFGQYWQQEVDYTMVIDFDHGKHQFTGKQELVYTNHSPDTLRKVYYHLYFNAFQPGSMMDVRSRNIPDPDRRIGERILNLKSTEIGYHKIRGLKQDGVDLNFSVQGTVMLVYLNKPILPGTSTVFKMEFESQVPVQIRRSGRNNIEGIDYTMTQWYPKMAEYDKEGWHPDQYVAREYYGVYGRFDVTINIDKKYTIGATGVLQNPEKVGKGYYDGEVEKTKAKTLSWNFVAENVHDFAWAADPNFLHEKIQVPNGPMVHMIYSSKTANEDSWSQLPDLAVRYFEFMDTTFGKYPYPQFSVIQGGDGGMEYPMCTMVRGNGKSFKGFFGLFVHETVHNWYYGIIGNNENRYPWMDEGFTSFAEAEAMNVLFPDKKEGTQPNPHLRAYNGYLYLVDSLAHLHEPMNLGADYFATNKMYSFTAYTLGQLYVNQMRYIVGEDVFWPAMRKYYYTYKFKHPQPEDFLRMMEKESNMELDWFPQFWFNTTRKIDYSVAKVEDIKNGTLVALRNEGDFPMPLDVWVILNDGSQERITIPLLSMYGHKKGFTKATPWPWTNPNYQLQLDYDYSEVKAVFIDPLYMMCDVVPQNNSWVKE